MAQQTFTLPAPSTSFRSGNFASAIWNENIAIEVDDALTPDRLDGTSLPRFLRNVQVYRLGSRAAELRFSSAADESSASPGNDLTTAFETNGAVVFRAGTAQLTLPASVINTDQTEPYDFSLGESYEADIYAVVEQVIAGETMRVTISDDGIPSFGPEISNKISTLAENATYTFAADSVPQGETASWSVKSPSSGGGAIDSSTGLYTPPNVSADTEITVALTVDGTEEDTVTFTVTPVFTGSISNKISTLRENQTHQFTATGVSSGDTATWQVKSGGGTIAANGTYTPTDISADTTVVVALLVGGTEVDTDDFTVTPVRTGSIANPISTIGEGETHAFTTSGVSDPTLVTWQVKTGLGSITSGGIYSPPDTVSANSSVTVALLVGGTEVDTDDFTITPPVPVQVPQYAYIRAATEPALPNPNNQRSTAGVPSGWSSTSLTSTTTLAVYRISRTVTRLRGEFQSGDTDWAFDPTSQPWRDFALSSTTQYAYIAQVAAPPLPTGTDDTIPTGWSANAIAASSQAHVWRVSRTRRTRSGQFVEATAWAWTDSQPGTPWREATATTRQQFLYRRGDVDTSPALPTATTQAISGWATVNPGSTADMGVYRIVRTVTERLGAFVSATAPSWSPGASSQPWQDVASDKLVVHQVVVRHRATGAEATVSVLVNADVEDGVDGEPGIRGLSGYSHTYTKTSRTATVGLVDSPAEWFLSGSLADWNGTRTLTCGVASNAEAAAYQHILIGSLVTLYRDRDNWGDYLVTQRVTISGGTGDERDIVFASLASTGDGVGNPEGDDLEIHFSPSGRDGKSGVAYRRAATLNSSSSGSIDDNGDVRAYNGSTVVSPIRGREAPNITRIDVGVDAGDSLHRRAVANLAAGDAILLEDHTSTNQPNWSEYVITTAHAFADSSRTRRFDVRFDDRADNSFIGGALTLGFSAAPDPAEAEAGDIIRPNFPYWFRDVSFVGSRTITSEGDFFALDDQVPAGIIASFTDATIPTVTQFTFYAPSESSNALREYLLSMGVGDSFVIYQDENNWIAWSVTSVTGSGNFVVMRVSYA